ncbi:f263b61d-2600-440a-b974-8c3f9f0e964e [Thermothielavioides terrestris]|nr:f263b61d-2600-440a-b974-8c3f9f0e964e [Thermothielavioides terrestris]
MPLPSRA